MADPGFTPTVITPAGPPTFSTAYGAGWTGEFVHLQGIFAVDNNFSIVDCTVRVDAGFRIVVQTGFTLTIDQSLVTDCDNIMWSTIEVEDGATVEILTGSTVANAEVGVTSVSAPGSPAAYTIRDSRLENNHVGIDVLPYAGPGAHPGVIENSEVLGPLLKAPYAGDIGFIGLRAEGVWDALLGEGLVVGDPTSTVTAGVNTNDWHDMEIGMVFVNSRAEVQNNIVRDMTTQGAPPSLNRGIGIGAASDGQLIVGAPTGGTPGVNNRILDCEKGILTVGLRNVTVLNNEVLGSGGLDPTMNQGIWVQNQTGPLLVQDNVIREFDSIGIYVRSYDGLTEILNNTVENVAVLSNNSCRIAGIEMRAGKFNAPTYVNDNTVSGVQFGIGLNSLLAGTNEVVNNTVSFRLPAACSGDFAFGIQAENVERPLIRDNTVTADCPGCTNTNIRGMDLTECPQFLVDLNEMTDCGVGVAANGPCPGGNFTCNRMNDCFYGFGLVGMDGGAADIGPVTDNIALLNGAGNRWFPATTANRTIAVTDPGTGTPTFGTPPSGTPPPFPIEWLFHSSGSGSAYNMLPAVTYNLETGIGSRHVVPVFISPGLPPCDIPPRIDAAVEQNMRIRERKNRFSGFSHILHPDSAAACRHLSAKRFYHHWAAEDTTRLRLEVPSDALFRATYDVLEGTSLSAWWRYRNSMLSGDIVAATAVLTTMVPHCPQDQKKRDVLEIWHHPALGDSLVFPLGTNVLPYDGAQLLTLHQTAALDPAAAGDGVYLARALLGGWSNESWSARSLYPVMNSFAGNELRVYPNPLEDILYLKAGALLGTQPEEWEACIYDTQGREMDCQSPRAQFYVSMNSIELPSGSYLLKLRHQSGTCLTAKVFVR